MKAVGYIRVSTNKQAEDGNGLEAQEASIRDYCARQGLTLLDFARDEGVSGASGEAVRPGLAAVLAALEDGKAEALVVDKLDRLARDLVLQETIIMRLASKGVSVVATNMPELTGDDPTRVLIRQIFGAFSQYERALIRSRVLAGKAVKSALGGYVGGRPGFGWQVVDGQLVHEDTERAVLDRMLELKAEGMSMNGMAGVLNREGRPTRTGAPWSATTVRRILRRIEREAKRQIEAVENLR